MALKVLRQELHQMRGGQNGYVEVEGFAQFSTTDATGELPVPFQNLIDISVDAIGSIAPSLSAETYNLTTLSATASITLVLPKKGVIQSVSLVGATGVTVSDTNFWAFGLVNKTQTLTPVDSTNALNTTKATGGAALTAYTLANFTIGAAAALAVNANDVFEFTATKNSAATTINEPSLIVAYSTPGSDEKVYVSPSNLSTLLSDGLLPRPSNSTVTINRTGAAPTSGLIFRFRIRGR